MINNVLFFVHYRQEYKITNNLFSKNNYKTHIHEYENNNFSSNFFLEKLEEIKDINGNIIIFIDNVNIYQQLIKKYGYYFCFFQINIKELETNKIKIEFHNKISAFEWLKNLLRERETTGFFSLPKRNFVHKSINNLFKELKEISKISEKDNYKNELELKIKKIIELNRKPKKAKNLRDRNTFYFSDNSIVFSFSKDIHGQCETKKEDEHNIICSLSSNHFFGVFMALHDRHYDTYKTKNGENTWISGTFKDCHNEDKRINKNTHINIFCNDFIR